MSAKMSELLIYLAAKGKSAAKNKFILPLTCRIVNAGRQAPIILVCDTKARDLCQLLLGILERYNPYDMVAKSVGDDTNYKQLLVLPFDN